MPFKTYDALIVSSSIVEHLSKIEGGFYYIPFIKWTIIILWKEICHIKGCVRTNDGCPSKTEGLFCRSDEADEDEQHSL